MPHACFPQVSGAIHQKTNKNTGPHSLDTRIHLSYSSCFFRVTADPLTLLTWSKEGLGKKASPD